MKTLEGKELAEQSPINDAIVDIRYLESTMYWWQNGVVWWDYIWKEWLHFLASYDENLVYELQELYAPIKDLMKQHDVEIDKRPEDRAQFIKEHNTLYAWIKDRINEIDNVARIRLSIKQWESYLSEDKDAQFNYVQLQNSFSKKWNRLDAWWKNRERVDFMINHFKQSVEDQLSKKITMFKNDFWGNDVDHEFIRWKFDELRNFLNSEDDKNSLFDQDYIFNAEYSWKNKYVISTDENDYHDIWSLNSLKAVDDQDIGKARELHDYLIMHTYLENTIITSVKSENINKKKIIDERRKHIEFVKSWKNIRTKHLENQWDAIDASDSKKEELRAKVDESFEDYKNTLNLKIMQDVDNKNVYLIEWALPDFPGMYSKIDIEHWNLIWPFWNTLHIPQGDLTEEEYGKSILYVATFFNRAQYEHWQDSMSKDLGYFQDNDFELTEEWDIEIDDWWKNTKVLEFDNEQFSKHSPQLQDKKWRRDFKNFMEREIWDWDAITAIEDLFQKIDNIG